MTTIDAPAPTAAIYAKLLLLSAGLFVVGTNGFVIAGLLPQIAGTLHVSPSTASVSITSYAITVAIASLAISTLFPRVSRTWLMCAGLVLIAVGTGLAGIAESFSVFTLGRVFAALGGAALVPVATAAAPSLMPAHMRGRALALAGLGFTLAVAVGSPLGSALASAGSWRTPILALAGLALLLAIATGIAVRGVPIGLQMTLKSRFGVLRDPRTLLALLATLFLTAGFNAVDIFSAVIVHPATGGTPGSLALLLLFYGIGGVIGTTLGGRITDRIGSRLTVGVGLSIEIITFALIPLTAHSFIPVAASFAIWGIAAFGSIVPLQDRLVDVEPTTAGLALSWYSTAMYIGLGIAPLLGASALSVSPQFIPIAGAAATALALALFLTSFLTRTKTVAADSVFSPVTSS